MVFKSTIINLGIGKGFIIKTNKGEIIRNKNNDSIFGLRKSYKKKTGRIL